MAEVIIKIIKKNVAIIDRGDNVITIVQSKLDAKMFNIIYEEINDYASHRREDENFIKRIYRLSDNEMNLLKGI